MKGGYVLPSFRLLVIRSADVEITRRFYEQLSFAFAKERHGNGPEHYSAALDEGVFEIYPATPKMPPDASTRLGFAIRNLASKIETLPDDTTIVTRPAQTEWGLQAVITDSDGRSVELYEI